MSLLKSLTSDESIENEKDSVGGNGPLDSGIYTFKIVSAYVTKADSEAVGLVVNFENDDKQFLRQTLWMTSGKAKGGNNYYINKKSGEKKYLPGYLMANSLALLAAGKEINQLDTEDKVIPIYSAKSKAEVPTKVPMIMDLVGKEVILGVIRQTVDKTVKDAAGNYNPTGETRDENELDKVFRASDRMTTSEIRAKAETPVFIETWAAKWTGKTKNKSSGATGASGTAGAPKAAGASTKPTTSLFS